jgi:predicted ribosome quality control (RQC) complex YloA/Tae2 family protein
MQQELIQAIVDEVRLKLSGRFLGKVVQLSPLSFVLDFGLRSGEHLLLDLAPSNPRLYLVKRRLKELEKQSSALAQFGQLTRSKLGGAKLTDIEKDPTDRIVRLTFAIEDETGSLHFRRLVVQLTGRAANLFLLDELDRIVAVLRQPKEGELPAHQLYQPPKTATKERREKEAVAGPYESPSAAADQYFTQLEKNNNFLSRANLLRKQLNKQLVQRRKLKANLEHDLISHGDPDQHKRLGDLLLANLSTAVRNGPRTSLTDYYAEGAPQIELEIDESTSLQEEATRQFRQYTKAKSAREEVGVRLIQLEKEILRLEHEDQELARIVSEKDEAGLQAFAKTPPTAPRRERSKEPERIPGVRRYLSSDGYEVLVGRAARDNDTLTFKLARPHDLWLHAGDYPGSHVVVRNPSRKEIPPRTIIEAAQLAGRFSQASEDSKVVIHYTERKYLSKPKGAAPGLVRMSSFKSITVEPKEVIKRIENPQR